MFVKFYVKDMCTSFLLSLGFIFILSLIALMLIIIIIYYYFDSPMKWVGCQVEQIDFEIVPESLNTFLKNILQ